jgi:hypothetical protein
MKNTNMKYAILSPADQTIVYQTKDGSDTIHHAKAKLWDNEWDAEIECDKLNNEFYQACIDPLDEQNLKFQEICKVDLRDSWRESLNRCDGQWYIIEKVPDEQEFRSRKDTW